MRHLLVAIACCCAFASGLPADDKGDNDTPKAAKARKLLDTKISVEFSETRLEDALEEIKDAFKEKRQIISFKLDPKGGVSRNTTLNYKAKDKPLAEILDGMFKKNGLGYYVISGKNNAYDGSIFIKQGKERGYPSK